MTPTTDEVQSAKERIERLRIDLQESFDRATEMRVRRIAEYDAATGEFYRIIRAVTNIQAASSNTAGTYKKLLAECVLKIGDSAAEGVIELGRLQEAEDLKRDLDRCNTSVDLLSQYAASAKEAVKVSEREKLLAEADQIDALVAQREFELELRLVPVAELEGQAKVDTADTVTAELKRRAGNLRIQAAGIEQQLTGDK